MHKSTNNIKGTLDIEGPARNSFLATFQVTVRSPLTTMISPTENLIGRILELLIETL